MTFVFFVEHILAIAIHYSERPAQIPESVSPACFLPKRERISHPRQGHFVRGPIEAAPLADMNLHAAIDQWFVRIDAIAFQPRAIPRCTAIVFHGPGGNIKTFEFVFRHPARRVMTDRFGQIATRALDQSQVSNTHHGRLADIDAIGKDQSLRIDFTNAGNERLNDLDVAFLEIAFIRSHFWRFIDQIETELPIRYAFIAFSKRPPMKRSGRKSFIALGPGSRKEISRLQLAFVNAISRNTMEIDVDVNAVLAAQLDR